MFVFNLAFLTDLETDSYKDNFSVTVFFLKPDLKFDEKKIINIQAAINYNF